MNDLIKSKIRTIPNWPKQGVMFRDITTLLNNPEGFNETLNQLANRYQDKNIESIVGIESRGFIIGAALADRLKKGFVPIRKTGKLPGDTYEQEYELEYGKDKIEIHKDAIKEGSSVLVIDDLIATGGTAIAACELIKKAGGEVYECTFVIDLPELGGTRRLNKAGYKTFSLIDFEGE